MKVSEIEDMLEKVGEDADLEHVWTKRTPGEKNPGVKDYITTLYFNNGGVKTQVKLRHSIKAREEEKKDSSPTIGDKFNLKGFFKGSNDASTNTLQENGNK